MMVLHFKTGAGDSTRDLNTLLITTENGRDGKNFVNIFVAGRGETVANLESLSPITLNIAVEFSFF